MKVLTIISIFFCLMAGSVSSYSSEGVGFGEISDIRYRSEYINFKITDENGSNLCSQCGPDISGHASGKFCYIHKDNKNLLSLFLSSYAMNKKASLRVNSWKDCNVYEFHLN